MWRRVFNTRGNTTMMALFVVGVVSTGVYFISNKIVVERKLNAQIRKDIHSNLALRSITDYIKYGIRKGWCFDEKLLPEKPELCANNYDNKFSSLRLMMPQSYAKNLEALASAHPKDFPGIAGRKAEALMLDSFEIKLDLTTLNINQSHALHRILTNLRSSIIKGLLVKVSRISNQTLPVNGDEVYIQISTEFLDGRGNTLRTGIEVMGEDGEMTTQGSQFFRETARFISNPREVNNFALMIPGTIYLGRANPPEAGRGDLAIPYGSKSDKGMVFNSPVFVNENIFVDNVGLDKSGNYTPATFNEVVIIGNGIIKTSDGAPFKINDSLGEKRYWPDLQTFGGFMRGIDSDGKRDLGLSTLAGASESTTLNNDIIAQCINIVRSQSDPNATQSSRLVGEPLDGLSYADNLPEFLSRFSFSTIADGSLNKFVPQGIEVDDAGINIESYGGGNNLNKKYNGSTKDESTVWYSFASPYSLSTSGSKLVMWARMDWGSDKIKVPILENGTGAGNDVTISFSPYSKDDVDAAKAALNSASDVVKIRQDKLAEAEDEKPTSATALADWLLNDKDGKSYAILTNPLNSGSVSAAIADRDKVEAEYQQRKTYYENPGQIVIASTMPNNGFLERQEVFRNVSLKIVNPTHFRRKQDTVITLHGGIKKTNLLDREINNFSLEAMDYSGLFHGISSRGRDGKKYTNDPYVDSAADLNNAHFDFMIDTSVPDRPLVVSNRSRNHKNEVIALTTYKPLDPKINYQKMVNKCFDSAGGTNVDAFKPASFASADFTAVTPDSWHFAAPNKLKYDDEEFINSTFEFRIGAIRDNCIIHPNASVVTGFFVCRNLEIKARTTPLQMIGTWIVTKNFKIDPSAIKLGVTWSSMHNQNSVNIMKTNSPSGSPILRRANGSNCATLYSPKVPFWHPDPGLENLADRIRCSSTFLLQGKGPPRWTSIDPDCGRIGDSTNTSCLKRIRNYNLIQLERVYGQ